jgi:N-methylhydantoinase B
MVLTTTRVDPITFEVVQGSLIAICRHMATALRRTAYSPIIHDMADFSCAIIAPDTSLVAQQEGCPIHLGTMPLSARTALNEYGLDRLHDGDILAVNDPYRGGVHLNDFLLLAPVFHEGNLIGFVANRAHWPDIGASEPGVASDATELLNEGVIVPPVRLRHGWEPDDDLINLILTNVRGPEERRGDLFAQFAALDTGIRRLQQPATRYGREILFACYDELLEYSRRRMRQAILALPDGVYRFQDQMDDDGAGGETIPVQVAITVGGDRVLVDYTGTGPQVAGPINSAFGMTLSSTYIILKALLDPFGPSNSGFNALIEVIAPPGSLVNPRPGAPVFGGGIETGLRIYDVIQGALAPVLPERVTAAHYGTIDSSFMSGMDPRTGKYYIYNDCIPGGWGAKHDSDGLTCMIELVGNIDDIPIEIAELKHPLRYRRSELRTDSGGAGKFRGGLGTLREIEVLGDAARCCIQADRTASAPYGLFGGKSGARTRYSVVRPDGQVDVIGGIRPDGSHVSAKRPVWVYQGEALRIESAGGGGYGDPRERDRERVRDDVGNGYISPEAARTDYGLDDA